MTNIPTVNLNYRSLKNGKSYYLDYSHPITGKRVRKTLGQIDKHNAVLLQSEEQRKIVKQATGIDTGPVVKIGVEQLFGEYYKQLRENGKKESSIEKYKRYEKIFISLIETFLDSTDDVTKISPGIVELAFDELRQSEYANSTFNNLLANIKAVFQYGVKKGFLIENPAEHINSKQRTQKSLKVKYFNPSELEKLWCYLEDHRYYDLYKFYYHTGLRLDEGIHLIWDHVMLDWSDPKILIEPHSRSGKIWRPKTNHSCRYVPLNKEAIKLIEQQRGTHIDFVFSRDGEMLNYNSVKKAFSYACNKILGWGGVHNLRHTYGTYLAMKGTNLKLLKAWMGHSKIETTMRYAHAAPEIAKGPGVEVLTEF